MKEGFSPEVFEEKPIQILSYVNILLRKRWLIIGGTFVLMLFAAVYFKLQPPAFTASAKFLTSRTADISARMSRAAAACGLRAASVRCSSNENTRRHRWVSRDLVR